MGKNWRHLTCVSFETASKESDALADTSDPRLVAALQRSLDNGMKHDAGASPSQHLHVHAPLSVSFDSLFMTLGSLSTFMTLGQSLFSLDEIPLIDAVSVLANLFLFIVVFPMGLVFYGRRLMQQDIATRMGLL